MYYDDLSYYYCGESTCRLCGGYVDKIKDAPFGCPLKNKEEEKEEKETKIMKLNELIKHSHVIGYGFKAIVELSEHSADCSFNDSVVSSLSPAVMAEKGILRYYAPVLPRGAVYHSAEELIAADLDINVVCVEKVVGDFTADLIVSRHPGTIEMLAALYPNAEIVSGNITPKELEGKRVVGTLPPHLIQHCNGYRAAVIEGFDYSRDGDLSGEELKERFKLCDPIKVTIL